MVVLPTYAERVNLETALSAKHAKQREQGQVDAPEWAFTRTVRSGSLLNSAH